MSTKVNVEAVKILLESLIRVIAKLSISNINDEQLTRELAKSVGVYDRTMDHDYFAKFILERVRSNRVLCLAKICQILDQILASEEIRIDNIASLIVCELNCGVSKIRWSDFEEAMEEHERRYRFEQFMRSQIVQQKVIAPERSHTSPILSEVTIRTAPVLLDVSEDKVPIICETDALEQIECWTDQIAEQSSSIDGYMTDFFQTRTQEKYREVIMYIRSFTNMCEWYLAQAKDYYDNAEFKKYRCDFLGEMQYIERILCETRDQILSLQEYAVRFQIVH